MKKIWIDDERNPKDFLSEKEALDVLWIKEIREALCYVQDNSNDIEVLYLDYYMDSNVLFGSEFVYNVNHYGRKRYPNLKTIYLHSSADDDVEELMELAPELKKEGIELKVASYNKK